MESLAYTDLWEYSLAGSPGTDRSHRPWITFGSTITGLILTSLNLPAQAIVSQGAFCDNVKQIQEALVAKKYDAGKVDGIFGTQTYNAIVKFQTDQKLKADGLVGPATATALGLKGDTYNTNPGCEPISATPSSIPNTISSNPTPQIYTVTADALNVRSGPASTYEVVGILLKNSQIEGKAEQSGWVQLKEGNWVAAEFLQPKSPSPTSAPETKSTTETQTISVDPTLNQATSQAQVTVPALNVRSGPGTDYDIVGVILQNEIIPLSGKTATGGWVQLAWGDWVSANCIQPVIVKDSPTQS